MTVGIETYRPGRDDAEVLALRARVWGADHPHTTPAFLAWLFQRNPAGPGSGILLRRRDELIGFAGLAPRVANRAGRPVRVAHGLDFMVDPEATKGLSGAYAIKVATAWTKLAAAENYGFGVNFPNANSYRLLTSTRLGWRLVLAPRLLVRPLPGLRLREGLPGRVPPALADLGIALAAKSLDIYARLRRGAEGSIQEVATFDWLGPVRPDGAADRGFARDSATLAWRYGAHPVYSYRILANQGAGGSASGLVTTTRKLFGVESTLIVDLIGDPRPEACIALAARAVADARARGARIVGALACRGDSLDRSLRRLGFIPVPDAINPKPFVMVAHGLAAPGEASFAGADWRFTWGDTDVV